MPSLRILVGAGVAALAVAISGTAIANAATLPAHPTTVAPVAAKPVANPSKASIRATYVVTASSLNVRSGPGTHYRIVSVLHHGIRITVNTKTVNGFREISPGRWVSARYLAHVSR